MQVSVQPDTANDAERLWCLLLLLRRDLHMLLTKAKQQIASLGAARSGSPNEMRLAITAPVRNVSASSVPLRRCSRRLLLTWATK